MDIGLIPTIVLLAAALAVFGYANWRSRQPVNPLRLRMVNYRIVQVLFIVVILVITAHLLTLIVGHPITGGKNRAAFGFP